MTPLTHEHHPEDIMDVQLIIDPDVCVGYGECVAEDADAVELMDDGCARFRLAAIDQGRADRICAACPVGAISVAAADRPAA